MVEHGLSSSSGRIPCLANDCWFLAARITASATEQNVAQLGGSLLGRSVLVCSGASIGHMVESQDARVALASNDLL